MKIDPARRNSLAMTGIIVRAEHEGKWGSFDIVELDAPSLLEWLRSRGGKNPWAENVIGALLDHPAPIATAEPSGEQTGLTDQQQDRVDAERWRAFLASDRIKLWGWAGFDDSPAEDRGYRHFGGEFWSIYSTAGLKAEQEQTRVRMNEQAREILTKYADALRAIKGGQ